MKTFLTSTLLLFSTIIIAQTDQRIYNIVNAISSERIEADIKKLAGFGTRHTLSDTVSNTRGIGAARVLSKYKFESSIIYVGLSGEEQGLFGGLGLAAHAKKTIGIL